jgi:7-cyano-7-deazaguanine tRNA-ribosyltransferase
MFEVLSRDGLARVGKLTTPHGTVRTPALLPVINPRLITVEPNRLRETYGFEAIITNSYIIRNNEKLRERALSDGLHSLLDFDGAIMTDSGTFQSHMYGEVGVSNREIVSFQREIGSDIGTVLDIFTEPYWGYEETSDAVDTTLSRTEEASRLKGEMLLAGVVQGSVFPDLRESCARSMGSMGVDVHPIGGVVPLMESYRYPDLVDVIVASKKGLDPSRPVHLFGAGHPMVFALAALLGCDMFDSASYAKFARDGRFMTVEGTFHLKNMKELDCQCPACSAHDITSLKSLDEEYRVKVMAEHNLWASKMELDRVRRAILEGNIWELVERRCRAHPALLDGLRRLSLHQEYLERYEPLSREGALFYTGSESVFRPAFSRYRRRLSQAFQFGSERLIEVEETSKPYNRSCTELIVREYGGDTQIVVRSPLGPVPIELDEAYPVAQSLFPAIVDRETKELSDEMMSEVRKGYEDVIECNCEGLGSGSPDIPELDLARVRAVMDYQFGPGASEAIIDGEASFLKSRTTGKIRNVFVDGEHVLSMRASDGLFTLRPPGAERLMRAFPHPRMRVVVEDDAVPFNREGKNAFCKFIIDCDPGIVPMDEVMVVDKTDNLVAIGRAILVKEEMIAFEKGIAVKVREGIKN